MIPRVGTVTVTVTRPAAGDYVSGTWSAGAPTTLLITASVQPASARERHLLPESVSTRETIKLYTTTELAPTDTLRRRSGDRIAWRGRTYEVASVEDHAVGSLSHYKAMAVLVDPEDDA